MHCAERATHIYVWKRRERRLVAGDFTEIKRQGSSMKVVCRVRHARPFFNILSRQSVCVFDYTYMPRGRHVGKQWVSVLPFFHTLAGAFSYCPTRTNNYEIGFQYCNCAIFARMGLNGPYCRKRLRLQSLTMVHLTYFASDCK